MCGRCMKDDTKPTRYFKKPQRNKDKGEKKEKMLGILRKYDAWLACHFIVIM